MDEKGRVTSSYINDVVTVTATGMCDLHCVEPFNLILSEAIAAEKEIVVDFREASYIDSAFLMALVEPARARLERNARLQVLVHEGAYPQYVLKTVGFTDLMDVVAE